MSRPLDTPATVAATLAAVLAGERPAWVSAATWRRLESARDALRADVARALADGPSVAARALGVGRATLTRWRATGGWLA